MTKEGKQKRNRWPAVGNIIFYGLLALLLFNGNARSFMLQQMLRVGLFNAEIKNKEAIAASPASFTFYTEEGKIASTADLKGKVSFINFWATWCPPCRAEMPSLQALYNQLKEDDRIVFLFINEDEDRAKAVNYLQSHQFTFPLVTRAGHVPEALFSGTLPTTVVLNKTGAIVYKKEGVANYNTAAFVNQLKRLF